MSMVLGELRRRSLSPTMATPERPSRRGKTVVSADHDVAVRPPIGLICFGFRLDVREAFFVILDAGRKTNREVKRITIK